MIVSFSEAFLFFCNERQEIEARRECAGSVEYGNTMRGTNTAPQKLNKAELP